MLFERVRELRVKEAGYSHLVRGLLCALVLAGATIAVPVLNAQKVQLSIDPSKTGAKIDRNLFGQFAEDLGHGLYEGIWVGPDSAIPNTRGIRNDVVDALKQIKVPNVRRADALQTNTTGAMASDPSEW